MEGRPGFLPTLFLGAVLAATVAGAPQAAETPKRGGILTYMIPADAPPSFDGHRETTFATDGTERIVARSHGQREGRAHLNLHEGTKLAPIDADFNAGR